MNYKKITDDIFIPETTSPDAIRLSELIAERDRLVAEMEMDEPSEAELLAFAKLMHPFYMVSRLQIDELNTFINTLTDL